MNEALILRLYGPGWPGVRTASGRYVVEGAADASPWVAIVRSETHRVVPRDQVDPKSREEALSWLKGLPHTWTASGENQLSIVAPEAAEVLLDQPRLQMASTRLQTHNLLASVPMRGRITVMVDTDRHRRALLAETRAGFDNARADRVCAFPLTIAQGVVTGLVREPPAGQKSWWKVW